MKELSLEKLPRPPLFKLVEAAGADVFQDTEVGGEPAAVGALFASRELAREFSAGAAEFGMEALAGLEPRELPDWGAVEVYAASGSDYLLVISGEGTGLFHAGDVAHRAAGSVGASLTFPLYLFSDEEGGSPLISVEDNGAEILVAALFSSSKKAHAFREKAAHLDLPDSLGAVEDADGLRRHALVARRAGAGYAVIDPGSGLTEAIPLEELIQ